MVMIAAIPVGFVSFPFGWLFVAGCCWLQYCCSLLLLFVRLLGLIPRPVSSSTQRWQFTNSTRQIFHGLMHPRSKGGIHDSTVVGGCTIRVIVTFVGMCWALLRTVAVGSPSGCIVVVVVVVVVVMLY